MVLGKIHRMYAMCIKAFIASKSVEIHSKLWPKYCFEALKLVSIFHLAP